MQISVEQSAVLPGQLPIDEAETLATQARVRIIKSLCLCYADSGTSKELLNPFSDDTTTVSISYLLELLHQRAWNILRLYKISRYNSDIHHYVTVLESGHIICDCMMGVNLGIPCRHAFAVLYTTDVMFHLSFFNSR